MRTKSTLIPAPHATRAMARFMEDREMLARLKVTPAEIGSLKSASMLGTITSKADLLLMLRVLRGGGSPDELAVDTAPPSAPAFKTAPAPILRAPSMSVFASTAQASRADGSMLGEIVGARVPQQILTFLQGAFLSVVVLGLLFVSFDEWRGKVLAKLGLEAFGAQSQTARIAPARLDYDATVLIVAGTAAIAVFAGLMIWRMRTSNRRTRPA